MSLWFCNNYPTDVWVSIFWYNPDCGDGSIWEKKGWWHLPPLLTFLKFKVFDGDLEDINRYWYFHAEARDGATWGGPHHVHVPNHAFDWCVFRGETGDRIVGFRELDVNGNDDYTVTLIP